jgi:hypothetical protein
LTLSPQLPTQTPPHTHTLPAHPSLSQMMRIREDDFWRTLEAYRECSGAREELSRRVVQEHVRDNRCVAVVSGGFGLVWWIG